MRVFTIDGQTVLASPSWNVSDRINSRTTMSCEVVDLLSLDKIDIGDPISLSNDGSIIFSGLVKTISISEQAHGKLSYQIQAVDNSALADKVRIAKVYENYRAGDIAKDLIAERLSAEGVTAGNIQDGPVIVKAVFNYITIAQALDQVKDLAGFIWYIDKDKKLHFFNRLSNKASFDLTNDVQHINFKQQASMDGYRNTQYVRGGQGRTSTQSQERPTPKPDGESRNFVLRFPLADKPIIEVSLAGGAWTAIDPADIGVNGIDANKKWYFTYNSQTITQESSEVVLGPSDAVRVTYTGLRNLLVKVDNVTEISSRQSAETGTSGLYEDVAVDNSIDTSSQAIQYADGLLVTYGQIKDSISFDTNVGGLQAGQLLRVYKPVFGLDDYFLIESISLRPDGPEKVRYSINALDGASVGGWETFFKVLNRKQSQFIIADNEVIIVLYSFQEKHGVGGEYQIYLNQEMYPSNTLYPSNILFPGSVRPDVVVDDNVFLSFQFTVHYPSETLYPSLNIYPFE